MRSCAGPEAAVQVRRSVVEAVRLGQPLRGSSSKAWRSDATPTDIGIEAWTGSFDLMLVGSLDRPTRSSRLSVEEGGLLKPHAGQDLFYSARRERPDAFTELRPLD